MDRRIVETITTHELGRYVLTALHNFIKNDLHLLKVNANERSLSHCLAVYLQDEFPGFNVDCEYNRDGIDPKRLPHLDLYPDSEDENAKTVFPDIIVHRRGSNDNLLVIEIKKTSNQTSRDIDFAKLRGYREISATELPCSLSFPLGKPEMYSMSNGSTHNLSMKGLVKCLTFQNNPVS
jgi:hypothetical protein